MSEPLFIETIPATLAGERIDRAVSLVADISRSAASELIAAGRVLVDGVVPAKGSERLVEHQVLEVRPLPVDDRLHPDPDVHVPIVHVDDDVLVVNKPAGLVVHPGAGVSTGTMVQGLLARFPEIEGLGDDPRRPGIVHRLDKGTSGLLLVGRSPEGFEGLTGQLRRREVLRRYHTLVWGDLAADRGTIDAPIGRSNREPTRQAIVRTGRPARTHYEVISRRLWDGTTPPSALTEVRCRLETGRTHQIRVHLDSIGNPVVADPRYGRHPEKLGLRRPFLHAEEIGFRHPVTGEELTFRSPLPADLADALARLT